MKLMNLIATQFSVLIVVCYQEFAAARSLKTEIWADVEDFPAAVGAEALGGSVRDLYDDALREALQLLSNQRLQITLTKHQLYRMSGQSGPTLKVLQVLDSLDTVLEKKANALRDKVSLDLLVTGDAIEQPIDKSFFDSLSKSWRQVKSIIQEEQQSSRFPAQVGSLLRWLDNIDLEMAMQYSNVEGLIAKLKLIS